MRLGNQSEKRYITGDFCGKSRIGYRRTPHVFVGGFCNLPEKVSRTWFVEKSQLTAQVRGAVVVEEAKQMKADSKEAEEDMVPIREANTCHHFGRSNEVVIDQVNS